MLSHVPLFVTPGSSVHGFSRQEYWSGMPCPPPWDLSDPGIEPASLASSALADGFFTSSGTWEVQIGDGESNGGIQWKVKYNNMEIRKKKKKKRSQTNAGF